MYHNYIQFTEFVFVDDALNDVIKLSNESFVCEMCKDISGLIEDTVTGAMVCYKCGHV